MHTPISRAKSRPTPKIAVLSDAVSAGVTRDWPVQCVSFAVQRGVTAFGGRMTREVEIVRLKRNPGFEASPIFPALGANGQNTVKSPAATRSTSSWSETRITSVSEGTMDLKRALTQRAAELTMFFSSIPWDGVLTARDILEMGAVFTPAGARGGFAL